MDSAPLYKIGEVATQLETTTRTLRFYEEEGLVTARRTIKGTRLYSETDIIRFRSILNLAQAGIPLALIKELATTREKFSTGKDASKNVQAILAKLQSQVLKQNELLNFLKIELSNAMKMLNQCTKCKNLPTRKGCPKCPVNFGIRTSEILNLLWEQDL